MRSSLFSATKNPTSMIMVLGFAFIFFDLQYVMMAKLPGYEDEMCVMGAGLNLTNIFFAIAISIMAGFFIIGFYQTLRLKQASVSLLSLSGLAAVVGSLTVFCLPCTIPVLSIFGLALGFGFFTDYNIWFKLIALSVMFYGLHKLNQQLKGKCQQCLN